MGNGHRVSTGVILERKSMTINIENLHSLISNWGNAK